MISEELRNFMTIAECLNFTEASKHLRIAQPALSRQISRLETDLGVKLFERSTRKVNLTLAGATFLSLCRSFTVGCDSLLASFPRNALSDVNRGIVIGMGGLVETTSTMRIINVFVEENPQAPICIVQYNDSELMDMLANGQIDIAVVVLPLIPSSEEYEYCLINHSRFRVAVWKNHPLSKHGKVKIRDLKNEHFVMNAMSSMSMSNHLYKICEVNGFFPIITGKASSNQLLFMMIGARQGISFSAVYSMKNSPANVVFLEIDEDGAPSHLLEAGVAFVWRRSIRYSSALMQSFIDKVYDNV